jgi:murein DD-endopeptidase MepM/ murein hydrolase activator NlpD
MPFLAAGLVMLMAQSIAQMGLPVQGLTSADLHRTFNEVHNGHAHEAIDIMAPRGTSVHAAVSGTIRKLFLSKPGGNTIYEFDEASEFCYYYAHLDRYAEGVHEGMRVTRGDVIAYVGSTGNADSRSPHLHFALFELGPKREWWKGKPIDPYPNLVEALRNSK